MVPTRPSRPAAPPAGAGYGVHGKGRTTPSIRPDEPQRGVIGGTIIADFDQSVDLVLTAVWTNGVVMSGSARPARMSFVGLRDSFVASDALSTTMPSGVVTFLFTDVEGSTRRWESDPDAMRIALADHDSVLQSVIEAHEGWTFKHTGDGVCAAFSSACHAVDAAIEAQLRLALPVRMGLATGEVEAQGSDYFDVTLNRTARVMSAGHGGQILVAASTAELLDEVDLIDLGSRRLRDLSEALQIFQVRSEGLRVEFPPLKTVDTVPGNLPVQATSFIGREAEVRRARRVGAGTSVGDPDRCGRSWQDPGRSMHQIGLAADMAGDHAWVVANCSRFALRDFAFVNDEPWHVQPFELPTSRFMYEQAGSPWAPAKSTNAASGDLEVVPGMRGPVVGKLQDLLIKLRLIRDVITNHDQFYGPATVEVIRRFQATAGLRVDGRVGPMTWAALRAAR